MSWSGLYLNIPSFNTSKCSQRFECAEILLQYCVGLQCVQQAAETKTHTPFIFSKDPCGIIILSSIYTQAAMMQNHLHNFPLTHAARQSLAYLQKSSYYGNILILQNYSNCNIFWYFASMHIKCY